eukprot:11298847-Alexandrium_andersonii.AAC.1
MRENSSWGLSGGATPPPDPPAGASGASGLSGGATVPPDPSDWRLWRAGLSLIHISEPTRLALI